DIQNGLLNSPNIKLSWIKAHLGHASNDVADLLAKKIALEGIPTPYPAPRTYLKRNFIPSPPNSVRMNGTTVTLEGKFTSSFQRSRLPQLRGKNQKSSLQRDMAHTQLTLRDLSSEQLIAMVVASWEALCTSQPAVPLQAHFILPSP
ncbi:hypothetical protein AVEN_125863-1, partial [Araneus ventricosus]